MIKVIHCTVNGKVREIAVDERESLTDMLRLRLGLTSVKKGCEAGECGACTVLIDGVAKNSCILLAVWADGHEIITVEGIRGKNGLLHPVQQAFVDEAAIQCGFCTPAAPATRRTRESSLTTISSRPAKRAQGSSLPTATTREWRRFCSLPARQARQRW